MAKVIKQVFIDRARKDDDLRFTLAKANKGYKKEDNSTTAKISTIDRWLRENDEILTTMSNLEIIASHFGVGITDLLEEPIEVR